MRSARLATAVTCAAAAAMTLPSTAAAAKVSASYGVFGDRTLHATVVVSGTAGRKARVLLQTRRGQGKSKPRTRDTRVVKRGQAKLRWVLPTRARRISVRARIVRRAGKRRLLATSRWKTLRVRGMKRAGRVAPVKPSAVLTAPAPGMPGDLVLKGSQKVRVGDVVAAGFGPATPEGLLVKAVTVRRSGANTVVTTQPATVPEVIPVGEFDIALPAGASSPGRKTSAVSPLQRLSRGLECTNGRQAVATGEASVDAGFTLSTKWGWKGWKPTLTARFSGDVRAAMKASASVSGEATCTMDREPVFSSPVKLHAFATSIGPVPIVGTVYGQVYLSGEATASGKIETSAAASAGASAGVEYDGDQMRPFGRLDKTFDAQPPTVSASGTVAASLAPAVDVRFYGVAGPEIDFTAGLKLAADVVPVPGEPWWRITAPLDLGVTFRLQAWKLDLESERFSVWHEEPVLLRAAGSAGGSSMQDQGPSPDPLPEGIRTRLVWDSNADVDLHTWDQQGDHAYFNDLEGVASGYLDQDVIPGYGPETFQETDPGHTFTFGICQYSGTQANVTVDVRDPDGQTRRFLVTLRGRKAASLLTASPRQGAGHVPAPGWCDGEDSDPAAIGDTTTGSFE